jgi:hypothetical protein
VTASITLVTFGDGSKHWQDAAKRLAKTSEKSGYFSSVEVWDLNKIKSAQPDFWNEHSQLLSSSVRGFGYWLWKPLIILETLKAAEPNHLVVYLDAGCHINYSTLESRKRFQYYCDLANTYGGLAFQLNDQREIWWNKMDTVNRVGAALPDLNTNQLVAGISVFKKNSRTLQLVEEWLEISTEQNYRFLDDSPSKAMNSENFKGHRHDQSIWSLLVKKSGFAILPDETYFGGSWKDKASYYPFWATRNSTGFANTSGSLFLKIVRKLLRTIRN